MVIHAFSQSSLFLPSILCAAGIGRTAQAAPGTGVPEQTACRETYGLLLYAGVAQMVRERGLSFPEIVSLVRVQPPAQEAG